MEKKEEICSNPFEFIIDIVINGCFKRGKIFLFCKILNNKENLLIHIKYFKNTCYNPFNNDIKFLIQINEKYLIHYPEIFCLTSFSFPTLFDQRNLLFSIIGQNWVLNRKNIQNFANAIEDLILAIPNFLLKVKENEQNKILFYYGYYTNNHYYNLNEFFLNPSLSFYRTSFASKKEKEESRLVYLILTDICILFFSTKDKISQYLGKLKFSGKIQQMDDINNEINKDSYNMNVNIRWTINNVKKSYTFKVLQPKTKRCLIKELKTKQNKLNTSYQIFQEDKQGKLKDYKEIIKQQKKPSEQELLELINFQEMIYNKSKSPNVIRELISLYQEIICYYAAKGNPLREEYKNKLKDLMLESQEMETPLPFESNIPFEEDDLNT